MRSPRSMQTPSSPRRMARSPSMRWWWRRNSGFASHRYRGSRQQFARPGHAAILAVEIGQRHRVHLLGTAQAARIVAPGEGEAGILSQVDLEAEIACHAHGCLHRIVGDDAGDHELADPLGAEPGLQLGADEGAVRLLADDDLARLRQGFRLELVLRLARTIGGVRLTGIVADVEDRLSRRAPMPQQPRDIALRRRIVARPLSRPIGRVDRLLQVDDEEGGVWRERHRNYSGDAPGLWAATMKVVGTRLAFAKE